MTVTTEDLGRSAVAAHDVHVISKDRYLTREFAASEADRLWPRVWQIACREEHVAAVGDYVDYTIGDQSILVVRVAPDEIKAYFNACLHRGTQLKQGCGNAKELRCRYHAWRWNLDGSIKEVTDVFDFDPSLVSPDLLHLPECAVGAWGGFVFVNPSGDGPSLSEYLAPLADKIEPFGLGAMRLVRDRSTIIKANWKTALDAFNENYHAIGVHPQLLRYLDGTDWTYEALGIHSWFRGPEGAWGRTDPRLGDLDLELKDVLTALVEDIAGIDLLTEDDMAMVMQLGSMELPEGTTPGALMAGMRRMMAAARGVDLSGFSDDQVIYGGTTNVFPNTLVTANGGAALALRFRPNGSDPESCVFDVWTLETPGDDGPRGSVAHEFYANWDDHDGWDRILRQDLVNIPNVQKGMHSRSFERAICGRQEDCVVNFHRALMSYVTG